MYICIYMVGGLQPKKIFFFPSIDICILKILAKIDRAMFKLHLFYIIFKVYGGQLITSTYM